MPAALMEGDAGAGRPGHRPRPAQALEACRPRRRGPPRPQPAWPFEYAIDPGNAAVQVDPDGTPVMCLGQGAQLGYLPEPARTQLGCSHPD